MNLRHAAFLVLAVLLALPFVARGIAQPSPAGAPDQAAPQAQVSFDVVNVAGGRIGSAELAGRVVLLDLWATWCGPCEEALPFYAGLQERYGDQGLVVVAISVDDELATVQRFVRDLSLPFAVGWDEGQVVANALEPTTLPTSWLIGRDGVTRHVHLGFRSSDRAAIEQRVADAVAEPWHGATDPSSASTAGSGTGGVDAAAGSGSAQPAAASGTP